MPHVLLERWICASCAWSSGHAPNCSMPDAPKVIGLPQDEPSAQSISRTTDDTIAAIRAILAEHVPGTYANAFRLADFLRKASDTIRDEANDDMSLPSD
jgi:hypothetical protein